MEPDQRYDASKTLVLNADMRPLSWAPLSVWSWQDALCAVLLDRVVPVETYGWKARACSESFDVPSVVMLKRYQPRFRVPLTRMNVFLRDSFRCQYCRHRFEPSELTFDHVVPRIRGGRTTWGNVVTCCSRDNSFKGSKPLATCGLELWRPPAEPTPYEIDARGRDVVDRSRLHRTWLDVLYWDSELDP